MLRAMALVVSALACGAAVSGFILVRKGTFSACRGVVPRRVCELLQRPHTDVVVKGRLARVYIPQTAAAENGRAAIVVLHGSFDSPAGMFEVGFEPLADARGFLVVYPDMQVPSSAEWGYASDIPYLTALAGRLAEDFGVDPDRLFICGHSAGGTMSLFVQNEVDVFAAAGAVEAGVGHLPEWTMDKRGSRTMVIWNHNDPVLSEYGGEDLYRRTITTLRRKGSQQPSAREPLPTSGGTPEAELRRYPEDGSPELWELSWRSHAGTHSWPKEPHVSFDGARQLVRFFLDDSVSR